MNPDPLSTNSRPMSYTDALIVATILTLLTAATVFMPTHGYDVYISDPQRFAFDLIVFVLAEWISVFCALTGLTVYAKSRESSEDW